MQAFVKSNEATMDITTVNSEIVNRAPIAYTLL